MFFKAEYDLDFEVVEEELRESYRQKAKFLTDKSGKPKSDKEKQDYVDYCVKRDLLQKRKHGLKLCEAGAMNRVVREILGLKNSYTAAELSRPFVTARIVFRPDFSDKEVRAKLLDASIKVMTGVYGEAAAPRVPDMPDPIDVTPIPPDDEPPQQAEEQEPPPDHQSALADFQNCDQAGQSQAIKSMAFKKGYDLKDFLARSKKPSIEELSAEKRLSLFQHLLSLPTPTIAEEDVPF